MTRAAKPAGKPAAKVKSSATDFPIIGIGCSAGGLEALEKFLRNVPAGSGMAFVVVQHLDPLHVSALPGLLQRFTSMPVVEAEDGMTVAADRVYVIPPNKDLSLLHGACTCSSPSRRAACACRSTSSCAAWPKKGRNGPSASSCRAWAPTVSSACAPSRKRAG
jgi:chemotaxis response regulator CheB